MGWDDVDDEWTPAIKAAHPTRSPDQAAAHGWYGVAMRMVGNRHSKGELVSLVCWLLQLIARGERLPPSKGETRGR
jgi:uncharacterized protein YfiM (DUF2279 family)